MYLLPAGIHLQYSFATRCNFIHKYWYEWHHGSNGERL